MTDFDKMTTEELRLWPWDNLPLCDCGAPEEWLTLLHWILWSHTSDWEMKEMGIDVPGFDVTYPQTKQFVDWLEDSAAGDMLRWGLLYCLDKMGWLEHGSGIGASWLEGKGCDARRYLDKFGCNPDEWPDEGNGPDGKLVPIASL